MTRSPRTMVIAPVADAKSTVSPSKVVTSIRGRDSRHAWIISTRSAALNSGVFPGFSSTPTTTRSKITAARSRMSRCPNVTGSKLPGYTAMRSLTLFRPMVQRFAAGS